MIIIMKFQVPRKINDELIKMFPKQKQYIAAARIIDRLYRCTLHYKDDIIRLSYAYVEHSISRAVASTIINKLLSNNIIQVTAKHHYPSHTSTGYRINPNMLLQQNHKVNIIHVFAQTHLSNVQIWKIKKKEDFYLHPWSQIQSLSNDVDKQTELLLKRLKLAAFNMQHVKNVMIKAFPNDNIDTITRSFTLDQSNPINNIKQRQLIYTYSLLIGDIHIQVHKGQKGGRLHHNFCHISKEIWQMLQPANKQHVKCSIDLNAAQPTCLHKILPFPKEIARHINNGTFYQYIQAKMYPRKSRQTVKKIVFSQMFNGGKRFWDKFSSISQQCAQYRQQFRCLLQLLHQNKMTLASQLQKSQSTIFNKLYHQLDNTIIRYDQLVIIGPLQQVVKTEQYILSQFQQYFQTSVACHVIYSQAGN